MFKKSKLKLIGVALGAIADRVRAIKFKLELDLKLKDDLMSKKSNLKPIADYNRAIELNPKSAAAYGSRARAKYELGDYDGAVADYSRAIALTPDFESNYFYRGRAKSELGDHDGAEADRKRALELDPTLKDY